MASIGGVCTRRPPSQHTKATHPGGNAEIRRKNKHDGHLTGDLLSTCCLKSVGRIDAISLVQMSVVRAPKAEAINPPCPRKLPLKSNGKYTDTKVILLRVRKLNARLN